MGDFYDPMSIEGGLLYDDVYGGWLDESHSKKRKRERRWSAFDDDESSDFDDDEFDDDISKFDDGELDDDGEFDDDDEVDDADDVSKLHDAEDERTEAPRSEISVVGVRKSTSVSTRAKKMQKAAKTENHARKAPTKATASKKAERKASPGTKRKAGPEAQRTVDSEAQLKAGPETRRTADPKVQLKADSEAERERIRQNAEGLKAGVVKRIRSLQRKEHDRIEKLALYERAAECGSELGTQAIALEAKLENLRKREQELATPETLAYPENREQADELKAQYAPLRDRFSDLIKRISAASDELNALKGRTLFKNRSWQAELKAELDELRAQKEKCNATMKRLDRERSRRVIAFQLAEDDYEELMAVRHELSSAEAELHAIDRELETNANSFAVPNIYNGLTTAFKAAFEQDCVKAMRDYCDDKSIQQTALAVSQQSCKHPQGHL